MRTDVSMWGTYGDRPEPDHSLDALFGAMRAERSIDVACTPDRAWDLVASVERIGEFSPECVEARWLDPVAAIGVGARFEGRNRVEPPEGEVAFEWVRPCTVDVWEPPRRFAWWVGDRYDGSPASWWCFEIAERPDGVRLTQRFRHRPDGLSGLRGGAEQDPAHATEFVAERLADLEVAMESTLARMKQVLDADAV
ncbi:MAG TPA: SRPBCC family protein [Candidatus Nanopelagicales bacterium]|nr:SRPBCC family protein [Candidatus Nanopelagicales bacterium]